MKKSIRSSFLITSVCLGVLGLLTPSADAQTILLYDSGDNYVPGGGPVNFNRLPSPTSFTSTSGSIDLAFNSTTPLMATKTGYTGPTFYGGWQATIATVDPFTFSTNSRVNSTDTTQVAMTVDGAGSRTYTASFDVAYAFQLAAPVAVADFTNISFTLSLNNRIQSSTGNTVRVLVESGGVWYVSTDARTAAGAGTLSVTDFNSNDWAVLNTGTWSVGTFDNSLSADIGFVGLYGKGTSTESTALGSLLGVGFSNVQYTVVPEPSAAVLTLAGLGLLIARRIRARRQA